MKNATADKVGEAEHFLSMMKQPFEDDKLFAYNLSAFLSAARTITWYMQKQYKHRDGFAPWYCQKQIEMSADPELEYLNDARVEAVHTEPVATGATRVATATAKAFIVKPGLRVEVQREVQGKSGQVDSSTHVGPKTVRRFFPKFRGVGVIEFCETQLAKLSEIARECEGRFG